MAKTRHGIDEEIEYRIKEMGYQLRTTIDILEEILTLLGDGDGDSGLTKRQEDLLWRTHGRLDVAQNKLGPLMDKVWDNEES